MPEASMCSYNMRAKEVEVDETTVRQPDEPCKCNKVLLKPWWASITDAGNEGTDYVKHTRESCLTRTERESARYKSFGSPKCTCAAIQAADTKRHFRECPMRVLYPSV